VKNKTHKPGHEQYTKIAAEGLAGSAKSLGYTEEEIRNVPAGAVRMGLGCGNPAALAELKQGQVVLDLGSGAGLDAFVAVQKVGPEGKVIGVDMTPEMVDKANQFANESPYRNVEFKVGWIENLPVPDGSVDVIISNCVINHSPDKLAVFREALRVLRPGGLLLVADLVVKGQIPSPDSPGLEVWKEWLGVACGREEYLAAANRAGFAEVTVVEECVYTGPAVTDLLAGKIVSLGLRLRK